MHCTVCNTKEMTREKTENDKANASNLSFSATAIIVHSMLSYCVCDLEAPLCSFKHEANLSKKIFTVEPIGRFFCHCIIVALVSSVKKLLGVNSFITSFCLCWLICSLCSMLFHTFFLYLRYVEEKFSGP